MADERLSITGSIYKIFETQQVSASFQKRELVLTTKEDTNYPQKVLIEFTQDKCDVLNSAKVGDKIKVDININGRSWLNPQGEEKFFNSIQAWRLELLSQSQSETFLDDDFLPI